MPAVLVDVPAVGLRSRFVAFEPSPPVTLSSPLVTSLRLATSAIEQPKPLRVAVIAENERT